MTWYIVAVSLHIFAACVWIGGMVFLAAVLLPALRQPDYRGVALTLIRTTAIRFRWVGWAALLTLVVTGCANLAFRGYGWSQVRDGALWQASFGRVLALKLLVVFVVMLMSAWHDLAAGRQATSMAGDGAEPAQLRRFRRRAAWVGRIVLLLSVGIVVLGVVLVRGIP
ncbi:MAG TPA: CopD family protein [bacterium]|nr:CopD family protein [bacterium]